MQQVLFIAPAFDNRGPRTIRIENMSKEIGGIQPSIVKYRNSLGRRKREDGPYEKLNNFSFVHILFRFLGIYRMVSKFSSKAIKVGPLKASNFLIKLDLLLRVRTNDSIIFIVIVSPFTNYLIVPWLKKRFRKSKIVLDVGDPLFNNSARRNDDNYSFGVEQVALQKADSIIVTNENTKLFFESTYNIPSQRIYVVPQGVDLDLIEEGKKNSAAIKPHTLAYAGRFYKGLRWPEALFAALRNQAKYELHLYGSNWTKAEENVVSHPKMLQAELFAEMCGNQILVFIDNDKGIQTSGKIYELLAFGKPLLFIKGSEESEASRLAAPYGYVFFAENNPESILAAIKSIDETHFVVEANAAEGFSWKTRAKEYEKALTL